MTITLTSATLQELRDLALDIERGEAAKLIRVGLLRTALIDSGEVPSEYNSVRLVGDTLIAERPDDIKKPSNEMEKL